MAARLHPVARSDDGRSYVCARCGVELPEGVRVLAVWGGSGGKPAGVRAVDQDNADRHACGTTVALTDGAG